MNTKEITTTQEVSDRKNNLSMTEKGEVSWYQKETQEESTQLGMQLFFV